ncbi:hypothetical protein LTR17_009224 [Elasticomyces elasticus]|nr:hypothetical protein LTR17_009224 [Elasticomyces elasticus]
MLLLRSTFLAASTWTWQRSLDSGRFQKRRCVTNFDCLKLELRWSVSRSATNVLSDNHVNAYDVFAGLPYEVTVDFSTPSWPPQLDHKLSVAGQKGLPSWKSVQPGLAILQLIAQSPSIFGRNEETSCHALYMLNLRGYEDFIDHSKLLGSMVSQKGTTDFCTLEELKAALKGGKKGKTLKMLMERMARKVVERNEASTRRSASAAAQSLRDLATNILLTFPCDSTSCEPEDDDQPIPMLDPNKHAGLFWSYLVWARIKNKKDQDTVPGDDCFLQRALTACDEQTQDVLSVRAKSRPVIVKMTGQQTVQTALRIRAQLLSSPAPLNHDQAREAGRQTLAAALMKMWEARAAQNREKAKHNHVWEKANVDEVFSQREKWNGVKPITPPPSKPTPNVSGAKVAAPKMPVLPLHSRAKAQPTHSSMAPAPPATSQLLAPLSQEQVLYSFNATENITKRVKLTVDQKTEQAPLSPSIILLRLPWQEPQKKPLPSSAGLARLRRSKSAPPKLEPAKEADLYEEQPLSDDLPNKPEAQAPVPVFEPHIIATPSPDLTSPSLRSKAWLPLGSHRPRHPSPAAKRQDRKSPKL